MCLSDTALNSHCEMTSQGARRRGTRVRERNILSPWLLFRSLQLRGSVLVDPEDPDAVKLRQFGNQDGHEGDGVDYKVYPIILGVKAG